MSNVPTTTPGPNDPERAPEGATETLPLITNVHATQQNGSTSDAARRTKKPEWHGRSGFLHSVFRCNF